VLYELAWMFLNTILWGVYGFRSYGRRNIPKTGGVILAINHQSFFDPIAVGCGTERQVHYLARDTLFKGGLGILIRRLNAFPLKREGGDVKALKEYISRVKAGKVVMLFPEGTRSHDGRLQALMPGVGMIAVRANAPVVPTYVDGTFDAWSRHMTLPGRARISIYYDRPLSVEKLPGESKRQQQERVRELIGGRLARLEAYCRDKKKSRASARREGPAADA
jgi:1-acyl-sn-glycerol-3-phosphate acyltransferase